MRSLEGTQGAGSTQGWTSGQCGWGMENQREHGETKLKRWPGTHIICEVAGLYLGREKE